MSRLLAVAARELRERWILFPAALVIGFSPFVFPAFGVKRVEALTAGLMGAVLLGAAAAVVIGSSMLARDAANGRLGFLFSRPVSWLTIWGGKWLAALVLVLASGLLAVIPWMVAFPPPTLGGHHDSWLRAMLDAPGAAFCVMLIVLAVGLANFAAAAFRSRSPWVALDLVLLLAALWAIRRYIAPLWWYGIVGRGEWSLAVSVLPLALGLGLGSAAQVAVGRTDLRRAHRALSLGFWAVIALTLATTAGYWQWVRSAGPAEVNAYVVTRDPAGRWVYVEGPGRHSGWYPHRLLIDAPSGRYARCPDPDPERDHFATGTLFSADGRFGAQPVRDREGRGAALRLFDLTGETPRLTEVSLQSSPPPTPNMAFALSPTAASVFVVHETGASLYGLPSGRRVATVTIPPGWRVSHPPALRFLADGTARAWLVPSSEGPGTTRAEMRVLDLAADGASRSVPFPIAVPLPVESWRMVVPDAEGQRIVTADAGLHLRDGATGELLATLAEGERRPSVLFLADGRIVVGGGLDRAEANPLQASLQVFDRAGVKLGEMRLDVSRGGFAIGPEVAPGRVVVSSFRTAFLPEDSLLVDVGEGRVVERLSGLRPAIGFWDASSSVPGAGLTSVHFFRDVLGRVTRIDFATGERKVVTGPGAPSGERIRVRRASAPSPRARGGRLQ
jgi:hypothetical protein